MPFSTLLNPQDPNPVREISLGGTDRPFVLVGDHAGDAIPRALGDLGMSPADRARHIAVDLGSQALGEALARDLGAPFVSQAYSRLVIDCNREPARSDSIVKESDGTPVPGNFGLSERERAARRAEIFDPYHAAIAAVLDAREQPILVSLHSFTPVMAAASRPWDVGVLHDGRRDDFARAVLAALQRCERVTVGDNEPYRMDATDYTVPHHAYARGLRYVEVEVRQDRLADADGIADMAGVIAAALDDATATLIGR